MQLLMKPTDRTCKWELWFLIWSQSRSSGYCTLISGLANNVSRMKSILLTKIVHHEGGIAHGSQTIGMLTTRPCRLEAILMTKFKLVSIRQVLMHVFAK
jgi:hypothetical protein